MSAFWVTPGACIFKVVLCMGSDGTTLLANQRLFAVADIGAPDGIKVDVGGNVYAGIGDGVAVFSASALLHLHNFVHICTATYQLGLLSSCLALCGTRERSCMAAGMASTQYQSAFQVHLVSCHGVQH